MVARPGRLRNRRPGTSTHRRGGGASLGAPLAGVAADGVRQLDDPLQRLEERAAEEAAAVITASRVVSEGSKLVRLAERAHEKVRLGSELVFHLVSSPIPRPYTKNYPLQTRR